MLIANTFLFSDDVFKPLSSILLKARKIGKLYRHQNYSFLSTTLRGYSNLIHYQQTTKF